MASDGQEPGSATWYRSGLIFDYDFSGHEADVSGRDGVRSRKYFYGHFVQVARSGSSMEELARRYDVDRWNLCMTIEIWIFAYTYVRCLALVLWAIPT